MRRSIEAGFDALRQKVREWGEGRGRPDIWVFVYPPEWEAQMLSRFPAFVESCEQAGWPVVLEDVGQGFLKEIQRRKGFADRLADLERKSTSSLLHDLGVIGGRYLTRLISTPLNPPYVCRLLVNTGSLGTAVSYSAITNDLYGNVPSPCVLAFPGDGDDRYLNLLGLRADTNYRVPRI
ncbi:MAG: hypothetical protein ACM3US_14080 [Sphingomonadaceae bacterium]